MSNIKYNTILKIFRIKNYVGAGLIGFLAPCGDLLIASEIVLPQERNVYYASEAVEISVAGLDKGSKAVVEISPLSKGAPQAMSWTITGDGRTCTSSLKPYSLSPGKYMLKLDGKDEAPLTIASGVMSSTIPLSQSTSDPAKGGASFILSNAFTFGLYDKDGQTLKDVRGKKSQGIHGMEKQMTTDIPAMCYMYWTGFLTHKPFGSEKSWANAEMQEAMRLLNFSVAQRLRRYAPLWLGVGPLDEPGLSWGKTPAGGMASGFPNWDEQPWYEARGWKYTQDIAASKDADWTKYMAIRCGIMKESYQHARDDIKTVWPSARFLGDLYALHAVMDGCDGLNQEVNDDPTTHVFFDWFGGPMSVPGQFYLDKCHAPTTKMVHAMNGQLEGKRGPQRPLYHWLMNGMLQGGLASNWWLNTAGMSDEDLKAVNQPVAEYGPLFKEMSLGDHDVAMLWGFTELCMREKEMARLEAAKKGGEQIKLMLPMPDKSEMEKGELQSNAMEESELQSNAYEVGVTYANQVLRLHQTLRRAGYAPHIVHEGILARGILKNYKVLCIVDQDFALPAEANLAIAAFVKGGGKLLLDKGSKVKQDGAVIMDLDLGAEAFRRLAIKNTQGEKAGKSKREDSEFATNLLLDQQWKNAVAPVKAALAKTAARAILKTDSTDLSVERHVGGEGELLMVLNGFEKYPEGLAADASYPRYNPAPATHTYTLQNLPKGAQVWCVEGLDWKTVSKLSNPVGPITADFAAGEMKLYLVAPVMPKQLKLQTSMEVGLLGIEVSIPDLKMPWPLAVSVTAPDGKVIYSVHRATGASGLYAEKFPLGTNHLAGTYIVKVESPVASLLAESKLMLSSKPTVPAEIADEVRILDREAITSFLAAKPSVTIVLGEEAQKPAAEKLVGALDSKGIKATITQDTGLLAKVAYPRVLNPFAKVYSVGGKEIAPTGEVKESIVLDRNFAGEWRKPQSLVTVGKEGFLEWEDQDNETAYKPGVKLYFDEKKQMTVLNATASEVKTDATFRTEWCLPWVRLRGNAGVYQLPAGLPEAYTADSHLIVLGDSSSNEIAAVLQASEILQRVADAKYPGPSKALVQFAWSPFAVGKNVIFIGASDANGLSAGADAVAALLK